MSRGAGGKGWLGPGAGAGARAAPITRNQSLVLRTLLDHQVPVPIGRTGTRIHRRMADPLVSCGVRNGSSSEVRPLGAVNRVSTTRPNNPPPVPRHQCWDAFSVAPPFRPTPVPAALTPVPAAPPVPPPPPPGAAAGGRLHVGRHRPRPPTGRHRQRHRWALPPPSRPPPIAADKSRGDTVPSTLCYLMSTPAVDSNLQPAASKRFGFPNLLQGLSAPPKVGSGP